MPKKYRKKPVVVEAIRWDGSNWEEMQSWGCKSAQTQDDELWIPTLEGIMKASVGDYIIKGIQGEFYPCKPDIFEATYDAVISNSSNLTVNVNFEGLGIDVDNIAEKLSGILSEECIQKHVY